MRKNAWVERDRARFLDPGNLDFVAEVDEEDEGEEGADTMAAVARSVEPGDLARDYALLILQARAELPEEGMWRSLAS
jgi:hypothetical protein